VNRPAVLFPLQGLLTIYIYLYILVYIRIIVVIVIREPFICGEAFFFISNQLLTSMKSDRKKKVLTGKKWWPSSV
jgi:hypothetical protein